MPATGSDQPPEREPSSLSVAARKRRVLDALNGDIDLARAAWARAEQKRTLRAEGLSYDEINDLLGALSPPTKDDNGQGLGQSEASWLRACELAGIDPNTGADLP